MPSTIPVIAAITRVRRRRWFARYAIDWSMNTIVSGSRSSCRVVRSSGSLGQRLTLMEQEIRVAALMAPAIRRGGDSRASTQELSVLRPGGS